ncbi:MAG: fatty acyl-AMP ligase [Vicinamibacterales bacterium]
MPVVASALASLCDLLEIRHAELGDRPAFTFLENGETDGAQISWSALNTRSQAIASALREHVGRGARVLLLFPAGLEFVPALLGAFRARVMAVPAYPPSGARHDRTIHRLRGVIADAGVELVLTTAAVAARKELLTATMPELRGLRWLAVEDIAASTADLADDPTQHDIALLQYTSGSTSAPRGVMVTHGNLLANLAAAAHRGQHDADSISLSWLPVNHDMGLIQGVLQPLFSGCAAWLMSPVAFLQRPARWLEAIARVRATHSGGPNFAFDLCVRRAGSPDALDLASWRVAFCGSEPVRATTLEAFHRRFAASGFRPEAFRPAYGLAEATLLVTTTDPGRRPRTLTVKTRALREGLVRVANAPDDGDGPRTLVGCGRVSAGTRIAIVDPAARTPCADDRVGEIWVTGASVTPGYWRQPHATDTTFRARLAGDRQTTYLRTGDLGFIRDGELFVTGRIKDVLIVRGLKHDPHDLELTVESVGPGVRAGGCAAFMIDAEHERIAVAVEIETAAPAALPDLMAKIRAAIAARHGIQLDALLLLSPGSLPKTTSGKVQRYACRDALRAGVFDPIAGYGGPTATWPLEQPA